IQVGAARVHVGDVAPEGEILDTDKIDPPAVGEIGFIQVDVTSFKRILRSAPPDTQYVGFDIDSPIFPVKEIGGFPAGAQEEAQGEGARLRDEHNRVSRSLRVGGSGIEENLVARTIKSRYYKDGSENLIQVGTLGKDDQASRIYSPEGVSPTLPTPGGGRHMPKIAVSFTNPQPLVLADRTRSYAGLGRNLESPKLITNALSGVPKD
ncbi:unnamed protein product, partial [marine sediment metagenome]